MNNSVSSKLVLRVSAVLASALVLLMAGTYVSLNRTIGQKAEQYTKVLVGVYADMLAYESGNSGRPIDQSFRDRLFFLADYFCSWYKVGYIFSYVPDIENGTITYLSVTASDKESGDVVAEDMSGMTVKHTLTEEESKAWAARDVYAIVESEVFGKLTEVQLMIPDAFGNKIMVGATVSQNDFRAEVMRGFLVVSGFMLLIVLLVAVALSLFIRRMVSEPAKRIANKMSEYASGDKHNVIRLSIAGENEFSMIAGAFNRMTEEIGNYISDIERLSREKERNRTEVDIASSIQNGFLPAANASLGDCSIKAVMKPAKIIGGDLYDYLELDETHTMVVVADVSGKGVPSAIIMAVALTLIRQEAKMGHSPAGILKSVNDIFSEENPKMMFVTAFIGIYDSDAGTLTYANAGHNCPYLIHDKPVILDGSDGTPLGLFPHEEYVDVKVDIADGDSVFLYTDGVTEAVNASGEFYGTDRLEQVLAESAVSAPKRFVEAVEKSVQDFVCGFDQNDDITILNLCARKKPVLELGYDIREFDRIKECICASALPRQLMLDLCVAAEECFVNICSYAFDGPAPEGENILFWFEYSSKVIMRFSDGGKQFDPRCGVPDMEEYDIDTAVGGLGRLIAFTIADSVEYEYIDGRNILTITKSVNKE